VTPPLAAPAEAPAEPTHEPNAASATVDPDEFVFSDPLLAGSSAESVRVGFEELQGTAPPSRARPRAAVEGPRVPHQLLTLPLDYAALPAAETPRVAKGETVAFKETSTSVAVVMARGLVSEVEVGPNRYFLNMAGNGFASPGSSNLLDGARFPCAQTQPAAARWRGFVPAGMKPGSLDFSELRGKLDPVTCVVEASTRVDVRAAALVPKTLYAFRRCDARCDDAFGRERLETLTVVAPSSSFVLASDAKPDDMINPHVGSFTVVEIPVAAGRAASARIRLPISLFERFRALAPGASRENVLGASGLEIDVEVVGSTSPAEGPSLTLHVSALVEPAPRPDPAQPLDPRRLRGFRVP
jgi:hypothetical protein